MASLRILQPLARQAPRLASRPSIASRRFLNTDTAPVLATSHAWAAGGRAEGHVKADHFELDLDMPKSLGGPGKKTNPEELFAAGYSACFQSAMSVCAQQLKIDMPTAKEDYYIETDVHLVGDLKQVDLGLRVDMKVKVKGLSKEDIEKLIEKTKTVCPYSRATQGNVSTNVEAVPL